MIFWEILKSIFIGIIQGITEWLPISSTGHMLIADEFIKLNVTKQFKELFVVLIQLGSILAVLVLYFKKLNPFSPKKNNIQKRETFDLWFKVIVASVPAAIIGLLLDDLIHNLLYGPFVIAIALIVYGAAFVFIEKFNKQPKINNFVGMDYKTAFFIGAFQALALVPGTSRSGATILGAVLLGSSRYVATEFSFFLAIPAMFGASAYKLLKHCLKFGLNFSLNEWAILLIGSSVAFIVSMFAIRFLIDYIKKNSFKVFGFYRIALGVIIILFFAFHR